MKDVTKKHIAAVLEAPAGLPSRHPQLPFREVMGMSGTWLTRAGLPLPRAGDHIDPSIL